MSTPSPRRPGVLYVVATPLGNLQDLTDRAKQVLAQVDLIAAEDTRRTRSLLAYLGLRKPVESYHQHSEREKGSLLLRRLADGANVALVTDAGAPLVSDPGAHLVGLAWEAGIRVVPIPGPSAVTCALSVAGFAAERFLFAGYPPRSTKERRAFWRRHANRTMPVVLFEAPHRVRATLEDAVAELGPERMALVAREMTKHFEEFRRGPLGELKRYYEEVEPLGEFTLVVAPAEGAGPDDEPTQGDARLAAHLLVAAGVRGRQAAEILATATGLSRNLAYDLVLKASQER